MAEQRLIDANIIPHGEFWEGLTDKEKAKVLAYLAMSTTVDAEEVVYGEWIDSYSIHNGKIRYSIDCSVCEEVFEIYHHDQEYWKRKLKRCFCCGAVMDRGEAYD